MFTVYYVRLRLPDGYLYKPGWTEEDRISDRFGSDWDKYHMATVQRLGIYQTRTEAEEHERRLLNQYREFAYSTEWLPPVLQSGDSELFTRDVLGIDNPPGKTRTFPTAFMMGEPR